MGSILSSLRDPPSSTFQLDGARLRSLLQKLNEEVLCQRESNLAVCRVLKDCSPQKRPIYKPKATVVLAGPASVGKTSAARCIHKHLYNAASEPHIIDMSEFIYPCGVEASLLESLREASVGQPRSVFVLKDIELCHTSLQDFLLKLIKGSVKVDFPIHESIFILTTTTACYDYEGAWNEASEALPDSFLPAVDGFVAYQHLDYENLTQIINHKWAKVLTRFNKNPRDFQLNSGELNHLMNVCRKDGVWSKTDPLEKIMHQLLLRKSVIPVGKKGNDDSDEDSEGSESESGASSSTKKRKLPPAAVSGPKKIRTEMQGSNASSQHGESLVGNGSSLSSGDIVASGDHVRVKVEDQDQELAELVEDESKASASGLYNKSLAQNDPQFAQRMKRARQKRTKYLKALRQKLAESAPKVYQPAVAAVEASVASSTGPLMEQGVNFMVEAGKKAICNRFGVPS